MFDNFHKFNQSSNAPASPHPSSSSSAFAASFLYLGCTISFIDGIYGWNYCA
jgi:hypothetical protein